ncbi:hypothetical protein L6R52_42320 [Myxococcota bacterium]|nr:hypothetical protein [Myxococcota bacterium]
MSLLRTETSDRAATLLLALHRRNAVAHAHRDGAPIIGSRVSLELDANSNPYFVLEHEGPTDGIYIHGRTGFFRVDFPERVEGRLEEWRPSPSALAIEHHRTRRTRRTPPRDDLPLWLYVKVDGTSYWCPVLDLGFGGLGFDAQAIGADLTRLDTGRELPLHVEYEVDSLGEERRPGRARRVIELLGEVTFVGPGRVGVRVRPRKPETSDGRRTSRAWAGLVAAHLFPNTTIAPAWSEELIRVLREKYLAHWARDPRVDAIVRDFPEVANVLMRHDLGHNVVYHHEDRGLATISFIRLFPETHVGHQIAIAKSLPVETWHEGLRQAYAHGFELPAANASPGHIIAGYCTGERQWLKRVHLGYARKDPANCHALPIHLYRIEVDGSHPAMREEVHTATDEELCALFDSLACSTTKRSRHTFYRKSLALMEPFYTEHLRACREDAGLRALLVGRLALSVRDALGKAIAIATIDTARIGTNVLGLFDHCRVYALVDAAPDDGALTSALERARVALLQAAGRAFAELGRPWFHYSEEYPEHVDAPNLLDDEDLAWRKREAEARIEQMKPHIRMSAVGPGFYFALKADAVQDFLENLFIETADSKTW